MAATDTKDELLAKNFTSVKGIPFPLNPLNFFNSSRKNRIFVSVSESSAVWKQDLSLGEKLFADTILCSIQDSAVFSQEVSLVKEILQKRMTYPGVKENPDLMAIAKTWILSTKVHQGPPVEALQDLSNESALRKNLSPILRTITGQDDDTIQCVKVELSEGRERMFMYQMLDNGFRPGLLLVKWSYDADDHFSTAQCAGHILNTGYDLVRVENGYFLYVFRDQSLYDICSMKTPQMGNPIMRTLSESALETVHALIQQKQTPVETQETTESIEPT